MREIIVFTNVSTLDSISLFVSFDINNLIIRHPNGDTLFAENFNSSGTTDVVDPLPGIPSGFILHQNYPNPFNPSTRIRYELLQGSDVKLEICNLLGESVSTLINTYQSAGTYEATCDGLGLPSGVYIYTLVVDGKRLQTKKMTLMK